MRVGSRIAEALDLPEQAACIGTALCPAACQVLAEVGRRAELRRHSLALRQFLQAYPPVHTSPPEAKFTGDRFCVVTSLVESADPHEHRPLHLPPGSVDQIPMHRCFRSDARRAWARVRPAGNPPIRRLDMAWHCGPKRP